MHNDTYSLRCATCGWYVVTDPDDEYCPECGASPGEPLNPDLVTENTPGLADWIADNAPQCAACEEPAEFVMPVHREPGEKHLRWKCAQHGLLDAEGRPMAQAGRAAA